MNWRRSSQTKNAEVGSMTLVRIFVNSTIQKFQQYKYYYITDTAIFFFTSKKRVICIIINIFILSGKPSPHAPVNDPYQFHDEVPESKFVKFWEFL